ncbi:hypothetical protein GWK47_052348 [Chionoecetes opilio]|uniref:Reverse transcriptase n=1 Tax=Chionoecetes opilio TaxID=41210 RepID=A0A8J4Y916_CHIOP|nr:hypothetical protein GWK47_052348 [Chionoecetes opilio]
MAASSTLCRVVDPVPVETFDSFSFQLCDFPHMKQPDRMSNCDVSYRRRRDSPTWVPSHIGVRGNTGADRAAAEATLPLSPIDMTTDLTDSLTNLQTTCNRHWDTELTDALQYTSLGRIRQDTRTPLGTQLPQRALDTAVTRLRIGHTRLNAHLHKLGMTDDPHCPWCPTYLDTPKHLLLQCPRHHSHRTALLQSLSPLLLRRPTLADLLGGSPDPGLAFKILKHTRTFLHKSGQLHRI